MTITITSVFKDGKLYPEIFLGDDLYELNVWIFYVYIFFGIYKKTSEITDLTYYQKKPET